MIKTITDQLGHIIEVQFPPARIISLVPSQTELLFDLGLTSEVVGITKFCVHPLDWQHQKTKIGGTKKFQFDTIDELRPDLIIGNKEENYQEGIERLKERYPVWMSDIKTLEDAIDMIHSVARISNREIRGNALCDRISQLFSTPGNKTAGSVLYLIWKNPWMGVGKDTFIHSILEWMGLTNCLTDSRYPELTDEMIQELSPKIVFLSSEPFPFRDSHIIEIRRLLPSAKIVTVDGEMFSWYGSRLIKAPAYFDKLNRLAG
jgi:ABC-type Fe3+-hydroxamate transport system substrate-binding protein